MIIFIYFRWHPCKKEQSIRAGSFFSQAKFSITQIIDIMYAYSYEKASYKSLAREIRIKSEAMCNWRNFIRDVYGEHLIRNPVRIGGVGCTVEIDESAFVKRKHNVGRQVRTQWVFGGLDTTTQEEFLAAVPRRDAATLLPVLQNYVQSGRTVVSDLWVAYNTIGHIGYQHLTVNHSIQHNQSCRVYVGQGKTAK